MSLRRTFAVLAAFGALVACDKDKSALPPAELVDINQTLQVKELWSASVGDGEAKLRLALGGCVPLPPTGPANLSVQATDSTTVALVWTDTDKTEDGYQISRATSSSGPWNVIATVGNNVTGYTDPGLKPRTRYYYKVRAVNNLGRATWKGPVMAKTGKAGTAMAPTDLAATVESLGQRSHIISLGLTMQPTKSCSMFIAGHRENLGRSSVTRCPMSRLIPMSTR